MDSPTPDTRRPRTFLVYGSLTAAIILFNLVGVFRIPVLETDDLIGYTLITEGNFPWKALPYRPLGLCRDWLFWNILWISPELARGLYVLLFMVPISWMLYRLHSERFGLPKPAAWASALLPLILPSQYQIPAGVNTSYPLWALLFGLISLFQAMRYVRDTHRKGWDLYRSGVLLTLISCFNTEQSLFLLPPFAFLVGLEKGPWRRKTFVFAGFLVSALLRVLFSVLFPRQEASSPSWESVTHRCLDYLRWVMPCPPYPPDRGTVLAAVFLAVTAVGFWVWIRRSDSGETSERPAGPSSQIFSPTIFYLFFLIWSVSAIAFFITFTKSHAPRYAFLSGVGVNALLCASVYALLRGFRRPLSLLPTAVLLGLILYSGASRFTSLTAVYRGWNRWKTLLCENIDPEKLPPYSQIVVRTDLPLLQARWPIASGYYKFVFQRRDLNGLMGRTGSGLGPSDFCQHFIQSDIEKRKENRAKLEMERPLFLFVLFEGRGVMKPMEYVLDWRGDSKESEWRILKADPHTGALSVERSGQGYEAYLKVVKELGDRGIAQSEILWGGPPSENEKKRLGLGEG